MKKKITLTTCLLLAVFATGIFQKANAQWSLTGNAGTSIINNFVGTTDNKGLVFRTNNIERMRIASGGNIGIGLTTPVSALHVAGSNNTSLTGPGYIVSGNVASYNLSMDNNEIQARLDSVASILYLNYWGGPVRIGANPAIYCAADGKVGIGGNNNALYALTVNPASGVGGVLVNNSNDILFNGTTTSTSYGIFVNHQNNTSYGQGIFAENLGNGYAISGDGTNGSGVDGYSSAGDGVSAYIPSSNPNYGVYSIGSIYTSGTYNSSDRTLKKNIRDFTNAMGIINELKPKMYEYRNDGNYSLMNFPKGDRYGLIAQDVETILPGLVKDSKFETWRAKPKATDEDGRNSQTIHFKALNYTELIPIMLRGMQEQDETIQQLLQKVTELTQTVQALANKNSDAALSNLSVSASSFLGQNTPNPFNADTKIQCTIPASVNSAVLIITTMDGKQLQSYAINTRGTSQLTIHGGSLPAGQYLYRLVADNKTIDTKQMILTR